MPKRCYIQITLLCSLCLFSGRAENLCGLRLLDLSSGKKQDGFAYFAWTSNWDQNTPCLIYRQKKAQIWEKIDSVSNTTFYVDSVFSCADSIRYRIELVGTPNCLSDTLSIFVQDKTPPPVRNVMALQVSEDNLKLTLLWNNETHNDIVGYIVLRSLESNTSLLDLDTLWSGNSSFYIDSQANALRRDAYRICSFDRCFNRSILSSALRPMNILLSKESCSDTVSLELIGKDEALERLDRWEVWRETSGNTQKIAELLPTQNLVSFINPVYNDTFCLWVKAYQNQGENEWVASSVRRYPFFEKARPPEYTYLKNLRFQNSETVELSSYVDISVPFSYVDYYLRSVSSPNWQRVQRISAEQAQENMLLSFHVSEKEASFFQIRVVDRCDQVVAYSNILNTLILSIKLWQNNELVLRWNSFQEWEEGVDEYLLYSRDLFTQDIKEQARISPSDAVSEYEVKINFDLSKPNANMEFYVEAIQKRGGGFGFEEVSKSNTLKVSIEDHVNCDMPNAFYPGGISPFFGPIGIFYPEDRLQFNIYDRSGKLIFESRDFSLLFDGTYKGKNLPAAVYVYRVEIWQRGKSFVKSGSFTLIR